MTQFQPGMTITANRLNDGITPTVVRDGLTPAAGFTVSDFTAQRSGRVVTIDAALTRNTGAGTIAEAATGTGNIAADPLLATLPEAWRPPQITLGLWSTGAASGDVSVGTSGSINLRTITGNSGIAEGNIVRVTAMWLTPTDAATGEEDPEVPLSPYLNVIDSGAVGDGTTDDAPAIQAALNQARADGGGWVVIPAGTYKCATLPLRIYGNTRLTLAPGATLVRGAAGTFLLNGDSTQTAGGYGGHGNLIIEGGVWDMRALDRPTNPDMCLSIGHARNVTIRDLEIRDVGGYHAIELNSTKNGRVLDCLFRGYLDTGGRDYSEAIQLDLAKSVDVFGGFGPYDHTPCEDILISGCYVGASGTVGTTVWPRGVGSHSATITKWHSRVRVIGCSFEGLPQYAVSAYNYNDLTVSGNTFSGCGSGVRLRSVILSDTEDTKDPSGTQTGASQPMRNLAVVGNTFRNGGSYDNAIIAQGEASTGTILNLTITGNSIDTTSGGQSGIRLNYGSRAVVSSNVIANAAGTGISTENQNNMMITGNMVWTPGARGITCVSSDNSSILGNQVRDSANEGILLQTSSHIQVRNNFVKGASTAGNGTYSGIRLSASQDAIVITGNTVRPNSVNANKMSYGLSIDSTCTNISRYGNDCRQLGGTNLNGSISDTGGTSSTVATDLT